MTNNELKAAAKLIGSYFEQVIQNSDPKGTVTDFFDHVQEDRARNKGRLTLYTIAEFFIFTGIDLSETVSIVARKNEAYGNAIESPAKVFCDDDPIHRVMSRLDDKASRILRGSDYQNEDTLQDIGGYLLILTYLYKNGTNTKK